tara:strand:- start:782 stop:1303 length:522 start_codon:yes stop_codon:yes gene_type:complete
MKNRLSLSFLFLAFFLFSCAGVDVERNETNVKAEKDAAAGRKVLTPDSEGLLDDLFDDFSIGGEGSYFGFGGSITFGASLDKISFMPLASVDSDSGMIITEWYNVTGDENRIKITIQVFNDEMMDNSIAVQLFKQQFDGNKWVDQGKDLILADKIKFNILEEARLLKTTADLS